jgi:DNA replication and repair protein RecF
MAILLYPELSYKIIGSHISHVKGKIATSDQSEILEVILHDGTLTGGTMFTKRYLVNDVPKRRLDFTGHLPALLFDPTDLDIVSGSPSLRREFLDEVLEQTDRDYRHALLTYSKALRHRNALLQLAKETGERQEKQFAYWDELLIKTGSSITAKRNQFIQWVNDQQKPLFSFLLVYDQSIMSEERLMQYREAEMGSGVTLVGPHRDDLLVFMENAAENIEVKSYGSRGQQRLAVVQLKMLQLQYMQQQGISQPLLLLDDIFSELDSRHIEHVLAVVQEQQTIITTTHKEFIDNVKLPNANMIELNK